MKKKIRVLIIDDSATTRKMLHLKLLQDPQIEIVGTAENPYVARDILIKKKPDVITLDVLMPRMDGISFLSKYMEVFPIPTIMVSALTAAGKKNTLEALEAGAVDFVAKPDNQHTFSTMSAELITKIKYAAKIDIQQFLKNKKNQSTISPAKISHIKASNKIIAFGASTGGVEALLRILPLFPKTTPGIVIVQHMPAGFTSSFAELLKPLCQMNVKEANNFDEIKMGEILIIPGGNKNARIIKHHNHYCVQLVPGEKESGHCPSIDVLFESLAKCNGKNTIATLMTGMGRDGAKGLLAIRQAQGTSFCQDEATSLIYGMPAAAWEIGAAEKQVALQEIPNHIIQAL